MRDLLPIVTCSVFGLLLATSGIAVAQAVRDVPATPGRALSKERIAELNGLVKDWIRTEMEWMNTRTGKPAFDLAVAKFMVAVERSEKELGRSVLADMDETVKIFTGMFPYAPFERRGVLAEAGNSAFLLCVPKGYDPARSYPSVMILAGRHGGRREAPKKWFDAAWKYSIAARDTALVIPELPDKPYVKGLSPAQELQWIAAVLRPLGEVLRAIRLDRRRMFLDCSPGEEDLGLRMATYFPGRFAGVIFRNPVDPAGLRLASMHRVKVLIVSTKATEAACAKLAAAFDAVQPGNVTIVKSTGSPPRRSAMPAIDRWIHEHRRPLNPAKVVLAPTHDRFRKSHWVEIQRTSPSGKAVADGARLTVEAIRSENRLVIESHGVGSVRLYLNDALLNLDAPVKVRVNGKDREPVKLERDVRELVRLAMRSYDATQLYPTTLDLTLQK